MNVHHQGKRIPLRCNKQNNMFEGDVPIGRGEVMVYVKYPSDNRGFHAILKYNYDLRNSNT